MNRRILTVLVSVLAASVAAPVFAVDAPVATTTDSATHETHKQFREKWKAMSPAEKKQWKAEHPEQVKKMKERRAQRRAMKQGSAAAETKDSIQK